jgi:putative membrane protein
MTETDQHPSRFEVRATADSHFSWLRTRMAVESTLMSWVRTATALIGFGFTIVQFMQRFSDMEGVAAAARPHAARYIGLALIAAGVLALLVSTWQYRQLIGYLRSEQFRAIGGLSEKEIQTPLFVISLMLIFIGLFAFGAVFTRLV